MSRGRLVFALAVVAACGALPAPAEAALRWRSCEGGKECARLSVPLDRSGAVPGRLALRVLREGVSTRDPRGVTLVLAAEPGQSGIRTLADADWVESLTSSTKDRVVILDQRGTGGSGPLRCRDLEAATATDAGREAAACATLLGARRSLYRTSATVADIEALRAELGVERLTLIGTAYGAYVAQRYALAHPDRVARMVLDAPVDAAGIDALALDTFAAVRRVLPLICRPACGFARDVLAAVARLSERLERAPLRGHIVGLDGGLRAATLTPQELLFIAARADRDPFTRLDLAAAVVSALRGDSAPLFRLKRNAVVGARSPRPAVLSAATRAAILCEEVRFPADLLVAPQLVSPFGAGAAARSELMRLCRRWPTPAEAPPGPPGPMPDVPVLVVAGDAHLGIPLETARRTAARFPRAHLLTAPSLFGSPLFPVVRCTTRALRAFLAGGSPAVRCPRSTGVLAPGRPAPTSIAELRPVRGLPRDRGRVLRAFELTLNDLIEQFVSAELLAASGGDEGDRLRGPGLRGGRFVFGADVARVDRYELVPGVRVSLRAPNEEDADTAFTIDGPRGLDGRVGSVDDGDTDEGLRYRVRGRIGGQRFRARLRFSVRLLGLGTVGAAAARASGLSRDR